MCLAVPIVPPSKTCWPDYEQGERLQKEVPAQSGNPENA
jgi:hypothetical protein